MSLRLRVLLVEDDPTDAKLVLQALQKGGVTVDSSCVETPEAMRAELARQSWDLILTDWSMPRFSALAALAVIEELGLDVPVIVVSGAIGEETAVAAMQAGAKDFVNKDRLSRLLPAIERELRDFNVRASRRRAEVALQANEARFRAIIEHSHDGVVMVADNGAVFYASPAAKRMLPGVEEHGMTSFIHPEEREKMAAFAKRLGATPGASELLESRALLPDGTVRWLQSNCTNLLHEPSISAMVLNIRDVTEQRESYEALQESKARFGRLADSGIIGIVISDLMGVPHEVNDAALRMVGYTREEAMSGRFDWLELTPPEWAESDVKAGQELVARGVASPWEKELFRKDGTRVPVLLGVAMLEQRLCITFIADLSGQKRTEAALRGAEEQLRHAQKMEAVGRLAGGIAHDFNNALSVILSYAALMLMDLPSADPLRNDVEEVRKAAERAANLTRQLLLFSRQQVPQPRVLDLNDQLGQMDKMVRRLVGEDIEIEVRLDPQLGRVKMDPGYVEQVLMNLVVNARDAMPRGGGLTIETANREVDGVAFVTLTVRDKGCGMDKETRARIFEPFFTTKPVGEGTGLGLSTVFGIVKQSNGLIDVASEVGHGTTFTISLPRVDLPAEIVVPPKAMTHRGTETILLVEDDVALRVVAAGILRRSGYQVFEATGVKEARLVATAPNARFDLLLTDVVMPQQSGPELAAEIRVQHPHLCVLYMSGYTDESVMKRGIAADDICFLPKPFTPETLTRAVRHALDR